jgi:hypothetical protein
MSDEGRACACFHPPSRKEGPDDGGDRMTAAPHDPHPFTPAAGSGQAGVLSHSWRSASIGSSRAARRAGT